MAAITRPGCPARAVHPLLYSAQLLARASGLRLVAKPTAEGVDYLVYRLLPDGRSTRLGKRSSPEGLHRLVRRCAVSLFPRK